MSKLTEVPETYDGKGLSLADFEPQHAWKLFEQQGKYWKAKRKKGHKKLYLKRADECFALADELKNAPFADLVRTIEGLDEVDVDAEALKNSFSIRDRQFRIPAYYLQLSVLP